MENSTCYKCGEDADYDITINGTELQICRSCFRVLIGLIAEDPEHVTIIQEDE